MQNQTTNKQLRSFGLIVGGIFALLGVWPLLFRHQDPRWWAILLGAVLVVLALAFPSGLYWPNKAWMMVGHILGWINTRIILGVVFYLIVTPIGVIRRRLGKDSMGQHLRPDLTSYRVARKPRAPSHLTKQY